MLAGDADRERAVNVLKDAFTEGRLTQAEYEERIGRAYQARTYADLDALTGDIPRPPPPPVFAPHPVQRYGPMPVPPTNGCAVGSLVCAIAGTMTLGLSSVPAIVLGHIAKRQIRERGEGGDGLATAGLALGYVVVGCWAMLIGGLVLAVLLGG
jgi:Domain of unknown function (DUF1707)/Domain of unknown function (DUF4190)